MEVLKIQPVGFYCNTYAVTADGVNCILIDRAEDYVLDFCAKRSLTPRAVLLTHGHFDHVGGCALLKSIGADIYCGEREKDLILSGEYLGLFGGVDVPPFTVSRTVKGGDTLELYGINVKVVDCPGHSAGGVSYIIGNHLFTGDTLFKGSVGRSDLPYSSYPDLIDSVKNLFALSGDYIVCPGHGDYTTLAYERKYNPYVRA